MKVLGNHTAVRQEQNFAVYVLSNREAEVAVVPALGAKIISMKNRRTGREWMWHPERGLNLFQNGPGDDFSKSPLVGVDECLPTIEPCVWRGRRLPDHGEVWSAPWNIDSDAWKNGILRTSIHLRISPFDFERTLELEENELRFSYQLTNRGATPEHFLWAMHPLLRLEPEDHLVLPASTRNLMNGAGWIDALNSAVPAENSAKVFAGPLTAGLAAIHNRRTCDRLEIEWAPAENNALGIWLTRGGWHGHHHFAIEPSNACADALTTAIAREWCGRIAANATATWQVRIRIG